MRDAILGYRSPYLDLDFVLPERSIETAQAIARHYQAGFVVLDAARQIARVVFPDATADFARQVGPTLLDDLQRRDFTVNAIAYSPHQQIFVDPLGGQSDLAQRQIRMVSAQNLADDPLRLLRAYRQAAQLQFSVDAATRKQLHQLSPLLVRVAPERIRVELSYLLSHEGGNPWLTALWQDGLLQDVLPDANLAGLQLIQAIEPAAALIVGQWPALQAQIYRPLSDRPKSFEGARRSLLATAKLLGLVADDPAQAKETLQGLKYSRAEMNWVLLVLQGLHFARAVVCPSAWTCREQYLLFHQLREAFPLFLVVAIASGWSLENVTPLVVEYLNSASPIAHPQALMSGQVLMSALHLSPGPCVGKLLAALELAQAEGHIHTQTEALQFAKTLLPELSPPG